MKKLITAAYALGGVLLIIGVIAEISLVDYGKHIFTIGAGLFALAQINSPIETDNVRVKRLRRLQIIGALMFLVTAATMFFVKGNVWIAPLVIATWHELFTAFSLPKAEKENPNS